ncbi:LacI family transcriptional regulator [bacterium]|nr:LacI family transcriptional regulator [bacterium]
MNKKRSTIYDIAKMAGVSIGTVSRVMNGKDRVHPDTRARILALAEKYNFRPSAAARGLALNKTKTLMMLVSDVANVYFAELAKEISKASRQEGYKIYLGDSDETVEIEAGYLRALQDRSVDGLLIAPLSTDANVPLYGDLARRHFPMVFIDTHIEGVAATCVKVDNERGADLAVEYLQSKGRDRIGFVSGDIDFQTNKLRFQGFTKSLRARGLAVRDEYFVLNQQFLATEGFSGVDHLLSLREPPNAIFASSDLTAMACVRAVLEHGLRVPDDIAVVGFDNLSISAHMEIPLTTVAQPKDRIGGTAVKELLEMINNSDHQSSEAKQILIEPSLVVRESA